MKRNIAVILLIFVALAIVAGMVLLLGNIQLPHSFSFYSSGVTVIGLSNVAVLSNYQGIAGPWWIATALLGGGQTLNAQNPGGQTVSASNLNPNSSYICSSSCQQDNIQIGTLYSYLNYTIQLAGTPVDVYNISALGFGKKQINYQTCYGGPLIGTSGMPDTYNYSYQSVNFGGCSNTAAQQQAYVNYYAACSSDGGTPLVVVQGSSSTIFVINLGFFGIPINVNSGSTVGCYQLNADPYAYVYGLNSPIPSYAVKVVFNGQASIVSNNQAQNTSNPNLILYNIGSGFSPQIAPSETEVSVVRYANNNTANIEGASGATIVSEESGLAAKIDSQFPRAVTLVNATGYVAAADSQGGAYLVNSYVNTQFSNASFICSNQGTGLATTGCSLVGIKLPDSSMLYTRPEVGMLIKASLVGLYLGVSQFNITSVQVPSFRSGSQTSAYVQIQNTGNAQGGYTVTGSSQTGVTITPGYESGTLNPGDQQTLTFTLNDNANIQSNTSESVSFQICPNPMVGGAKCQTVTQGFTLVPQCNSNQQFNAGTCQTLTSITAPTTSVPVTTAGPSTSPTTTVPCNPSTGANCPGGGNGNNGGIGIGWIIVAIIIGAAIIALAIRGKQGGSSSYKPRYSSRRAYKAKTPMDPNAMKFIAYGIFIVLGLVSLYFFTWQIIVLSIIVTIVVVAYELAKAGHINVNIGGK